MTYVLNNAVMCKYTQDNALVIAVPDMDIMTVTEGQDILCDLFELFLTPRTLDESFALINLKHYIDRIHFSEYISFFRENNILKAVSEPAPAVLSPYHLEKYDRQIHAFHSLKGIDAADAFAIQKKLCDSCVCIIGLGGTGSHLALTLASIGVEHLILVDFDQIELSNTSRQVLYTEADVGKYKVDVAKKRLQEYNSRLDVVTYQRRIQCEDDLSFLVEHKIDLLILCADTPRGKIQYLVDHAAQKHLVPWFFYGPYQPSQILVGPYIIPGKTKSYTEMVPPVFTEDDACIQNINANYVAAICDPYNGFASQFAAIEALKILGGHRESALIHRRYYIDTDDWKLEFIDYDGN